MKRPDAPRDRWEALGLRKSEAYDRPADMEPLSLLAYAVTCGANTDPIDLVAR